MLVFHGFVKQFLAPVLHPGDIVVMDNLFNHKTSCVVEMREVQVVPLFQDMVRELVTYCKSYPPRTAVLINNIRAGYLRFLAGIVGKLRLLKGLAMKSLSVVASNCFPSIAL